MPTLNEVSLMISKLLACETRPSEDKKLTTDANDLIRRLSAEAERRRDREQAERVETASLSGVKNYHGGRPQ